MSARESLWNRLGKLDSSDVGRRAAVLVDGGGYVVSFMDREYRIDPASRRIRAAEHPERLEQDPECELLLLTYLLHVTDTPLGGRWITEKELPGGSLFFRGVHALPLRPLEERFGGDGEDFRRTGRLLGGNELEFGDVSFRFAVLPRIPMGLVLWLADEEFPARVTAMFDSSLSAHLPLDAVLALAHCAGARLIDAAP